MSWLDDYEAPHFRTKTPFDYIPLIVGIVVLVLVVSLVWYFLTRPVAPPVVEEERSVVPVVPDVVEEVAPAYKSDAPTFDSKCTVVAGVIPGSVNREGNKISFTFKNNGKVAIEGSYFEASNSDVKAYRQNSESLAPGSEITYSVDLNDVSLEVGVAVNSFVVLPVQGGKACLNQRMIVIG